MYVLLLRERTEKALSESQSREEELQAAVSDLETAKKEVEESLEIHLEEASQQVCEYFHKSLWFCFSLHFYAI